MLELLIVLTVLEVVVVLVVLAVYLGLVRTHLRTTAKALGKVAFGVRAIDTQVAAVEPGVTRINASLEDLAAVAPVVAEGLERRTRG